MDNPLIHIAKERGLNDNPRTVVRAIRFLQPESITEADVQVWIKRMEGE